MGICDLHVHSYFSDGMMSPGEIADIALRAGVTLLAIADHDVVEGSVALAPLCAARGIGYVSAVEHTCLWGDCFHVLSYGADLLNPALLALIGRARRALDGMSDVLIERMQTDHPQLSLSEFVAMKHERTLGGWKGIEYLMKKGLTKDLKQGLAYYERYGVRYEDADFPTMAETIAAIHSAGGRAVLAHPGEMIPKDDPARFERTLKQLLELGLDGLECYYPTHPDWVRALCLRLCEERALCITAGSDCHGSFSGGEIGAMAIDASQIRL